MLQINSVRSKRICYSEYAWGHRLEWLCYWVRRRHRLQSCATGTDSGGGFGAGEPAVVGFVGGDEAGFEGVVGDVLELFVEFLFVAEDAVEGFGLPEGALGLAVGVDFLRSATLYALHDSRK